MMRTTIACCVACCVLALFAAGAAAADRPHVDHVLLGAADLDRAVELVAQRTGVRAVYGGKHPGGTHNALLSLGEGTYLEIIAVQPGVKAPKEMEDLAKLEQPAVIGWAVSGSDGQALRQGLEKAGFHLTPAAPGSRVTPAGPELHWQTFGFAPDLPQAPFFIAWSADTPHPSTTTPKGCTLKRLDLGGPKSPELAKMQAVLHLDRVGSASAKAPAFTLTLDCPKGPVVFRGR